MTRVLEAVYARLPLPAQHAAISAYGLYWHWIRFGPGYDEALADYERRDRWDAGRFREWQRQRLRELLTICADHVPYYREHWNEGQRAAARRGDLAALPVLEKEPLRADPKAFLRQDARPLRTLAFSTSGTTGTPIKSFWSIAEYRRAIALREARSLRWAGVSFALPRATIASRMVEPAARSRGPFYRYNAAERQVYLSAFHVRPDTATQYADAIERHGVRWLTGFVNTAATLAEFMLDRGIRVTPLDAYISTSEAMSARQKALIEEAFGCRAYEEYSTVDTALFASECEAGSLHVSPDAGLVEILRPDGSPCAAGEPGDVVTTCLLRDLHPLVRYRLGDVAVWSDAPCRCGRSMPVLREVVGRIEDTVIGPDGRTAVRLDRLFTEQPNIRRGQVVQERVDRILVRVEVTPDFGPADEREIIVRAQQRLGPGISVLVEPVDRIELTEAGKFRAVISHVRPASARTGA